MSCCHKHGPVLETGRCVTCDDELIALGIQGDKDKIAELEAKVKALESKLCTCAAKDMPFGRCCKAVASNGLAIRRKHPTDININTRLKI